MNNIKICDIYGVTSKIKHVNWSNNLEKRIRGKYNRAIQEVA